MRAIDHLLPGVAILLAVGLLIWAGDVWQKRIASASVPATTAMYLRERRLRAAIAAGELIMNTATTTTPATAPTPSAGSLVSLIQNFDWSAPEASIDSLVEAYVANLFPAEAKLQPEANAAQAAMIALIGKILQVYALSKVSGLLAPKLAQLASEFPVAAPAIAEVQKILGLA